ncbi:MAG TPA: radical SAM protein [Polyangiaceae bacterium]
MTKLPLLARQLRSELESSAFSRRGELSVDGASGAVGCVACAHRCVVGKGARGACGVRFNRDGELHVPFGYVARRYVRAVETNTIFHLAPGARALTFGMFGCDLRCPYCHNHRLSQVLRDGETEEHPHPVTEKALVDEAVRAGCSVVCAAYNEPMIGAEWTRAVFEAAKRRGLRTAVVSDGHSTPEALTYLRDVTDVFRVDLKAHSEAAYRALGGRLEPVLRSIATARELGYWVEVVTLVVPGFNQERSAIASIGARLREIDPAMPWHLNGFVPRYRLRATPPADPAFLMLAAGAAYVAGSRYVYVGNVPACAELAHTRCPRCHAVAVRRRDYATVEVRLRQGRCPSCDHELPGLWD